MIILLTQLNIICISLFSVSLEYLHNDYTHRFTRSFQLLFCILFFESSSRASGKNVQRKKFPTNDAFVSQSSARSPSFGFIAHLIIPHIFKTTEKSIRIHRIFCVSYSNCIVGHFVGNRIMPVEIANDGQE